MDEKLSVEDRDLANYIMEHTEKHGYPPSRRQIQEYLGFLNPSSAQKRLERLVKVGVVQRAPGIPRGIKVDRERLAEFG